MSGQLPPTEPGDPLNSPTAPLHPPAEDTSVLPLAQSMAERTFDVVWRGYDRNQVDRHLDWLEAELARARADALRTRPSFAELGERVARMLELAEEEAAALVGAARSDSEHIRQAALTATEDARTEAAALMAQAEEGAARHVASAREQADDLLGEARTQARQILDAAHREVEELERQRVRIHGQLTDLREQLAEVVAGSEPGASAAAFMEPSEPPLDEPVPAGPAPLGAPPADLGTEPEFTDTDPGLELPSPQDQAEDAPTEPFEPDLG